LIDQIEGGEERRREERRGERRGSFGESARAAMPGSIDAGDDSFRQSSRGSFVTLPSLESQFQWERAVSKSVVGKKGKNDIKDMESVMQDLRRSTAVGKPSASKPSYSFTAVAHPQQNTERPIKRLPLPNRPLPHGQSGFQGDVMTTAMLAQLMDRSLVYSGVVDMRNRGITPALALTLSDKMSTFEIKKLDISMNDIGIGGFVHVCRGLLRMKGLEALKASHCGISFENADSNHAEINRQTREHQVGFSPSLSLSTRVFGAVKISPRGFLNVSKAIRSA